MVLKGLDRGARLAALSLIKAYSLALSPLKVCLFGSLCRCRFEPTCSQYAAQMYGAHNFFKATILTARRLLRCQPFYRDKDEQ
ncbi:MAG: membrane protein insertion efficiency factor YidD [Puniceicoccales bacterium]|nr:membrane protein insertion efficiency factor YidD [Puniceicoccales bacterium]